MRGTVLNGDSADGIPRKFGYRVYKQLGIKELKIPTIMALYRFDTYTIQVSATGFYNP